MPWFDKRIDKLVGMVMGRVSIACMEVLNGHINGRDRRLRNSCNKSIVMLLYNLFPLDNDTWLIFSDIMLFGE